MSSPHGAGSAPAVVCWGELLWDELPHGRRLGGCACNVAFHVAQLGQSVSLVSCVGKDELGQEAISQLENAGVHTETILVDPELRTGVVRVELSEAGPRYTIVERVAWDRIRLTPAIEAALHNARCFVFGTLAQRTALGRTSLKQALGLLAQDCIRVCDLNLRSPHLDAAVVETAAEAANVVKLNEDELSWLERLCQTRDGLRWLLDERRVDVVVLTHGHRGSEIVTREGRVEHPAVVHADADPTSDTVGAGDAYCAALAVGFVNAAALSELARIASDVAGYVASRAGATPVFPEPLRERWRSALLGGAE